jgi:membrane protease YdiL (CAAX protease family)
MKTSQFPNSQEHLASLVEKGQIPMRRIWGMLALRSTLTFGLLLVLAMVLILIGRDPQTAFVHSSAWWLWFVTVANFACIGLMIHFGRMEGVRLREIYFINWSTWKGDLLWVLLAFTGTAILAQAPGTFLARILWGDANFPNDLLFQPLPILAVYPLFLLMPVTQALAELPIYWGYVAPRLRASGMNPWWVIAIVGAVLSVQHMFFSFQLDWRFDLWLAIKFLPFALWTGFIIYRRPATMPYLMFAHFALDALLPYLLLLVSSGQSLSLAMLH